MNEQRLEMFKQTLLKMKQDNEALLEQGDAFETTELSSADTMHPGDNATDLVLQTTEMAIDDFREEEIEKIDAALQAIEAGTYGTCTECGEKIPIERLKIVPTALTCVEHTQ